MIYHPVISSIGASNTTMPNLSRPSSYMKSTLKQKIPKVTWHFIALMWRQTGVSVIRVLVNRGAPLEETNNWYHTPLFVAVMANNLEVAEFLISRGAQIAIEAEQKGGPLHRACRTWPSSCAKRGLPT